MWLAAVDFAVSLTRKGEQSARKVTVPACFLRAASCNKRDQLWSRTATHTCNNYTLSRWIYHFELSMCVINSSFTIYSSKKTRPQIPNNNRQVLQRRRGKNSRSRRAERRQRGILCEILPKVYGRLKGLKAWRKLDQGESSPNFHYFQVVWLN